MRKLFLNISTIFIFIFIFIFNNPTNACPIQEEDKKQILHELCSVDDVNSSSNRANEMIIMLKFGKLSPKNSPKSIRILAGLTCSLKAYKY